MMDTVVKPSLIIMAVAFVASLALSHVKSFTEPSIARQAKEKEENALKAVLPGYSIGEKKMVDVNGTSFTYWTAAKQDGEKEAKGYAFIASEPGYSGDVRSMVGVDDQGKVLGISILQQTETPGLGARATEVASSLTFLKVITGDGDDSGPKVPWFEQMFRGLDLTKSINIVKKGDWNSSMRDELLKENAVSSITGATITTRTVAVSLEKGMDLLKKQVTIPAPAPEPAQEETQGDVQ